MPITLVQDIAILLLAAGAAGVLCKKIGLSVIVGYLMAGVIIGPNTPIHFITEEGRIADLAQIGLVFVMFAIGLNLSITKLARMGLPTLISTGLGAVFVFVFTLLLGQGMGWSYKQCLFVAAMLMVSSSAVIAKIMEELRLTHNKTARMALGMTVLEDIVAVVMLTILSTMGAPDGGSAAEGVGDVFTKISAYVILILALSMLIVPRLLRRLDTSGDSELRTIGIAGVLLFLAACAAWAGFSVALGAFLFGAIIAELPQKTIIEKSFDSVRSIFSSIFFVSIGMMAKPADLLEPAVLILLLILVCFVMVVRPIACGLALLIVGLPPHEAKRGGMLLTPLGEFTFIIAQSAIAAQIFPKYFYPVAIALSIVTVLLTPLINRFAEPLLNFSERLEPKWLSGVMTAYYEWLKQIKNRPPSRPLWTLIWPKLAQISAEMLLVTGIFIFSNLLLQPIERWVDAEAAKESGSAAIVWLASGSSLAVIFWSVIGIVVLMFLVSIARSALVLVRILADGLRTHYLPRKLLLVAFSVGATLILLTWLFLVLPFEIKAFSIGVRIAILLAIVAIIAVFLRRLISWHNAWRETVGEVLSSGGEDSHMETREETRRALDSGLESWEIYLEECVVPDNATCVGESLQKLAIPSRFGGAIVEIERNGHSTLTPGPDMRLYPGDKVLLLGKRTEIEQARAFLESKNTKGQSGMLNHAVLETYAVQKGPRTGKTLAELGITRNTGVRVVGIQREGQRIINPTGQDVLLDGDGLLLMGTIEQIRLFAQWLVNSGAEKS